MDPRKALVWVFLTLALLSSLSGVQSRPRGDLTVRELTAVASDMARTLDEVMGMLTSGRPHGRSRRRSRRMVQIHMGRHHHFPSYRFRRGRLQRYRKQRGGRNADISDH